MLCTFACIIKTQDFSKLMLLNALRVSLTLQRIQFFKGGLNKLHNLIFQLSSLQKSQAYSTETSRGKKKKKHIFHIYYTPNINLALLIIMYRQSFIQIATSTYWTVFL